MYTTTAGNASSSTTAAASRATTIPYPILHRHPIHHPLMIPLPPSPSPSPSPQAFIDEDEFPRRDERFPQWGNQETRDLIEVRAQLEWEFTATKRNKNLWEMVANRMREKGYRRTTEQCKCKWKNLVNKYKGQEISDVDNGRLCPYFDELHAVFTARANQMTQPETGLKRDRSHEDISEEQDEEEETTEADETGKGRNVSRRKPNKEKRLKTGDKEKETHPTPSPKNESILDTLQEILRNFMAQQQMIDSQWQESMERRAEEREMFEQEWREKMEKLERERLMMEQAWREREEQRRLREETRAQKRDALLTTLLNKLVSSDKSSP